MTAALQVGTKLRHRSGMLTYVTGIDPFGLYIMHGFTMHLTAEQVLFYCKIISEKEYQKGMAKIAVPGVEK